MPQKGLLILKYTYGEDGNPYSNIKVGKASGRIGAGTTRIPLPTGFYIITLGGTGHKVIVK